MCQPMIEKVKGVIEAAKTAAGISVEDIDSVEMVGGASRVPWVKALCSEAFGGKDLCTTLNADECVARGCALQAAILSPNYKVRDFKVEDQAPFAIDLCWSGPAEGVKASQDAEGDAEMAAAATDAESKATLFGSDSTQNLVKPLT